MYTMHVHTRRQTCSHTKWTNLNFKNFFNMLTIMILILINKDVRAQLWFKIHSPKKPFLFTNLRSGWIHRDQPSDAPCWWIPMIKHHRPARWPLGGYLCHEASPSLPQVSVVAHPPVRGQQPTLNTAVAKPVGLFPFYFHCEIRLELNWFSCHRTCHFCCIFLTE